MYTVCYILTDTEELMYYNEMLISLSSLRMQRFSGPVVILTDESTAAELQKQKRCEYKELGGAELRIVAVPGSYTQKEKSRFLKTSMRDLLSGDFLFLDTDTVVSEPLATQFDQELALVLDYNIELQNRSAQSIYNVTSLNRECGYKLDMLFPYFNTGCIWAKDTSMVHGFFHDWHDEWKNCLRRGLHHDQPALNYINRMKGGVIQELPDVYNVQISASPSPINLIPRAKIIHYFNGGFDKIYLLQFPAVKANDIHSEMIQNILLAPKEAFSKSVLIPADKEVVSIDSVKSIEEELSSIRNSISFRLGRTITWFPRKVRGGVRCYCEHGTKYTFERVLFHLHLSKDNSKHGG